MKTRFSVTGLTSGVASLVLLRSTASAVEGGMGRPVSGAQITPYVAVVPPAPGFAASIGEIYYSGSIGGSRTVPVGANLTLGIDTKVSFTPLSLSYVWNTPTNWGWNFATAISLPLAWVEAKADVTLGPKTGHLEDETFGLFDLAFVPITASYHITPTDHLALNLTVWTPSGSYHKNELANLSLNNWTFIPGVAYTKIFPVQNLELSAMWALEFYTKNPATDYQNGILSDFELMVIKRFKGPVGVGIVGSWVEQITDDSGKTADALDGFLGRAFGVGPIVTYTMEIGKHPLNFNARWVGEFENKNRVEGNTFMLNAVFKF
jgi:hypothetical protein